MNHATIEEVDRIRGHAFLPRDLDCIPRLGATELHDDPTVWVSYFHPMSSARWLITERDPESGLMFGYVDLGQPEFAEWGYIAAEDIGTLVARGLPVERDCYFKPEPFSVIKARLGL